jgi:hypothetical protein
VSESECGRVAAELVTERAELARRWRGSWPKYVQGVLLASVSGGIMWLIDGHAAEVMAWTYAGWFGGVALFALWVWATTVHGWLHRHTGYVSMNGTVWGCGVCGKPPKDCAAQVAEAKAAEAERLHRGIYW